MKKILAIVGSPNKNGKTADFIKEIITGAENSGATATTYYLNSMDIKGCQACMYCKKVGEGCAINDDMQQIYKDFKEADVIVIGSPIYFYQISAQTKIFMDRLYALFDASFKRRYESKKAVMVYTQGHDNPDAFKTYIDITNNIFKTISLDIVDTVLYAGNDEVKREELLNKSFEIGKGLFK